MVSQRVVLDPARGNSYYAPLAVVGMALVACARGPASIAPSGLEPVSPELAAAWVAAFTPDSARRYDLRWRFFTPRGSTAGRAAVRVSPPDSLRFDYRGPFGRSGAAVVIGDSALWAEPESEVRDLIPIAPLFWAALGMPLGPPAEAEVFGRDNAAGRAWRYVVGRDTMDFVEVGNGAERLLSELRRGRILASSEVRFQAGTRLPQEGQMRFPPDGAAFTFTVEAVERVASFDPGVWRRP